MTRLTFWLGLLGMTASLAAALAPAHVHAADQPDLIFKRSTVFKWVTPNDKLATYGLDDPEVEGVACHFTVPEQRRVQGLDRSCRGGLGYFARLSAGRADPHQGQVRAGRRRIPQAPLAVLQENADRARLRCQAQRAGLHGLFGSADRRLAEELHLVGSDHALGGQRSGATLRRLRGELAKGGPGECDSVGDGH